MTPLLLLMPAWVGCAMLILGEYRYAAGMAAADPQQSVEWLTRAGEMYPYEFRFRTAQAHQLFALAGVAPDVARPAAESLSRAVAVDPGSVELVSKLLEVQRMLGRCAAAQSTAARLLRLAPRSEKAKSLSALPCEGPSDG